MRLAVAGAMGRERLMRLAVAGAMGRRSCDRSKNTFRCVVAIFFFGSVFFCSFDLLTKGQRAPSKKLNRNKND